MNSFGNTIPKGSVWECPSCGYQWDVQNEDGSLARPTCPCRIEEQSELKAERMLASHEGERL